MSFADALRTELANIPYKKNCCRRALASGFLLGAKQIDKTTLLTCFRNEIAAESASTVFTTHFGKKPISECTGKCGHRYWNLQICSPAAIKLQNALQRESENPASEFPHGCDSCLACFLRGAFIGYGTINDPQKSFHLEFLLPCGRGSTCLHSVLLEAGYPPKQITRPKGIGLYYKDSESIEDLITLMGAHRSVFDLMNSRIERDIRNNENRATNCVAKNIEKSISAAAKQVNAIRILTETGKLETLPEPLRETAELRYRNPDISLDELALLHSPCISKSGLNHRLQKIVEASQPSASENDRQEKRKERI